MIGSEIRVQRVDPRLAVPQVDELHTHRLICCEERGVWRGWTAKLCIMDSSQLPLNAIEALMSASVMQVRSNDLPMIQLTQAILKANVAI